MEFEQEHVLEEIIVFYIKKCMLYQKRKYDNLSGMVANFHLLQSSQVWTDAGWNGNVLGAHLLSGQLDILGRLELDLKLLDADNVMKLLVLDNLYRIIRIAIIREATVHPSPDIVSNKF